MHICIPLQQSLKTSTSTNDLLLATHSGTAQCFAVIDNNGNLCGECAVLKHCPGPCKCPLPDLSSHRVDAIATPAVGFRLMQMSKRSDIPIYTTHAHTLGELSQNMAELKHHRLKFAKCLTRDICK